MKTLILDASYAQKVALLENGKLICEKIFYFKQFTNINEC